MRLRIYAFMRRYARFGPNMRISCDYVVNALIGSHRHDSQRITRRSSRKRPLLSHRVTYTSVRHGWPRFVPVLLFYLPKSTKCHSLNMCLQPMLQYSRLTFWVSSSKLKGSLWLISGFRRPMYGQAATPGHIVASCAECDEYFQRKCFCKRKGDVKIRVDDDQAERHA